MRNFPKIEDWECGEIQIPDDEYVAIYHDFFPFSGQTLIYFVGIKTGFELGPEWSCVLEK